MKISEDLTKLIELGNQYGERVESLTQVTISSGGGKKVFTLSPIHPCPGVYDLELYREALANLTALTDALTKLGYSYLKPTR